MRRTQIYLEDQQHRRLSERARRSGQTVSELIREAIDVFLAGGTGPARQLDRYRRVVEDTFGIAPYLPSGRDYTDRLREADRARLR
ncbi:MAG: CopG family transcriptional regulator [Acidimicrobiia bacterium]